MIGFFDKESTASRKIQNLKNSTNSCLACRRKKEKNFVEMKPFGNFKKGIMIIRNSPTSIDAMKEEPWRDSKGKKFVRILEKLGIDVTEDCVSLYAIQCWTPKESFSYHQLECCRNVVVLKEIEKRKPRLIITLGEESLKSLIGHRWKGVKSINTWRGFTIPDRELNTWVCPTYSLDYALDDKSPEKSVIFKQDLSRALSLGEMPVFNEPKIIYKRDPINLDFLKKIKSKLIAFDYEASGIKPHFKGHKVVCVAIAVSPDKVYSFTLPKKRSDRLALKELLEDHSVKKIAANLKYETQWSNHRLGIKVKGWFWDTMVMAHILDNRPGVTGLKFQVYAQMGIMNYEDEVSEFFSPRSDQRDVSKSNAINKVPEMAESPQGVDRLLKYCAYDAIYEYRLQIIQSQLIENNL